MESQSSAFFSQGFLWGQQSASCEPMDTSCALATAIPAETGTIATASATKTVKMVRARRIALDLSREPIVVKSRAGETWRPT
jgi:hypothetical protein